MIFTYLHLPKMVRMKKTLNVPNSLSIVFGKRVYKFRDHPHFTYFCILELNQSWRDRVFWCSERVGRFSVLRALFWQMHIKLAQWNHIPYFIYAGIYSKTKLKIVLLSHNIGKYVDKIFRLDVSHRFFFTKNSILYPVLYLY